MMHRIIAALGALLFALESLSPAAASGQPRKDAPGVPDWVPIYPGGKVSAVETRKAGVETYTTFQLDTAVDCQKVFAWYDEQLKVAGFSVGKATPGRDYCDGIIRADGPGRTRGLTLNGGGAKGGPSRFGVQAVVRQLPGADVAANAGGIPAWVPQYPGAKPANVVARQEGPERSAQFNFTTADDAATVIGWYERQLKGANFTIVTSTVFDGSTAKLTAQDATGRSILNIRMEPAGARKVVAVQARDGGH
jgi:hypothetical protein